MHDVCFLIKLNTIMFNYFGTSSLKPFQGKRNGEKFLARKKILLLALIKPDPKPRLGIIELGKFELSRSSTSHH